MDAVRAGISKIDHHERAHLASRTLLFDQAQAKLQKLLVALGTVLVALLAAAIFFLIRAYLGWERTLNRERDLGARQEAIFEAARDGMIVVNASGSIESLNPAAARMFGFEAAELLRRDVGMLFEIAPDRGRIETFLKRLSAHRARSLSDTQEFIGRCKYGSLFPAEVSVSPVLLKSTTRFLAVLRDVSERKQVEQMKTEFVSIVSHELRTPLTSISGSLGLIVGGAAGELPARAKRLVEIAQTNCARLVRLINDILDIEKIESGRMVFDIKPISLDRLLNEAVEANGQFAADHGVELRVEPPPPKASIFGDEDRMMQVLTNLLSNATKFSAPGSIVHVSVTPLDRFYRISVADQGSGISPEFRDRIFTKFAQADSSDTRQKSGTGLGLSIVREIITRLGGSISFESEPGRGAVFHVDLPAAYSSEDADRPVHALGRVDDIQGAVVLHVDDDPDMLRVVATALEGRAEVRSTPSVVEARASIRRYAFDAVILDIAMADGDGLELIPDIRKRDGTGIIVFTAQEAAVERLEGADLLLIKSRDSLDRLVAEVERLAERSRQGSVS